MRHHVLLALFASAALVACDGGGLDGKDADLPGEPVMVMADQRALKQIVFNLAGNALKFTLTGGVSALIESRADGQVILTVDDSGRQPFLTVSLNIDYVGPALKGGVTATGRVVGGGRSLLFVAADLVHDDGTLIATASGVFKRVPTGTKSSPKDNP